MKKLLLTALLTAAFCPSLHASDPAQITQAELVHRTQQMMDALVPGDQASWKRYIADDAIIFDEKGRDMDKAALLGDVKPMPAGYTGSIRIVRPKSRFAPNLAVLSYDSEEVETIFGRELHARYHTTDTWLYRNQLWQVVASQTLRYYEDPAAGTVSLALLPDYVGTYELAPGSKLVVSIQGNDLYAQRDAETPYKLLPESVDLFFRPGQEGRKLFHRDAAGKIDMLIDRRNNEDLLWKKQS